MLVLDGCGVGALPDAAAYGDEDTNTLAHLAEATHGHSWHNLDYRISGFLNAPERHGLEVADYYGRGLWRTPGPRGAIQSRSDFGKPGYGGPCPPKGDRPHRYIFTIHALKVDHIDADQDASGALAGFMINANSIGKATLTGKYGRK